MSSKHFYLSILAGWVTLSVPWSSQAFSMTSHNVSPTKKWMEPEDSLTPFEVEMPGLKYWQEIGLQMIGMARNIGGLTGSTYVLVSSLLKSLQYRSHWIASFSMSVLHCLMVGVGLQGILLFRENGSIPFMIEPQLNVGQKGEWQPGVMFTLHFH